MKVIFRMVSLREKEDFILFDKRNYIQLMKENFETVFMMDMAKLHGKMGTITKESFLKIKRKVLGYIDLRMVISTWVAIMIHFLKDLGSQFSKTDCHFKECGKIIRCKVLS